MQRPVNTHVGLAGGVTVQDSGNISDLELTDNQCNIQRGTE